MSPPLKATVEYISTELSKLKESFNKFVSAPQLHGAVKSLKGLFGDLCGMFELVLKLVEPVVVSGESCGAHAVEIDQVAARCQVWLPCDQANIFYTW